MCFLPWGPADGWNSAPGCALRSSSSRALPLSYTLFGKKPSCSLHQILIPGFFGALNLKCRTQTDGAATRAIVALKAFKMKTGRLPKTLDELVPEHLAAVPLDDFDGKPLRYLPEKKILYSVGKELKDVGGFTKEETLKWWQGEHPGETPEEGWLAPPVWDLPNPSWPIEF